MDSLRTRAQALVVALVHAKMTAQNKPGPTMQQVARTLDRAAHRAARLDLTLESALRGPVDRLPSLGQLRRALRLARRVDLMLVRLPVSPDDVAGRPTIHDQNLERAHQHAAWLVEAIAQLQARSTSLQEGGARPGWWRSPPLRGLLSRPRHSLPLATWIVHAWLRLLPAAYRQRYADEWLGELEWAKSEREPLLELAVRITMRAPLVAVVLHCRLRGRQVTAAARRWPRFELAKGGCGAVATFLTAAVGMWAKGETPTSVEVLLALLASLVGGAVTGWPAQQRSDEHDIP